MPVGVYKRTKPHCNKGKKCPAISNALTGRKLSKEHIEKLRLAKLNNPVRYWLGKTRPSLSDATRKKMSDTHKKIGTLPPVRFGDKNNKWKGGISKLCRYKHYRNKEYIGWRKEVFERDDYTCRHCFKRSGVGVQVIIHPHHIKSYSYFPELRYEIENGITLCYECHKKQHAGKRKEGIF